MGYQTTRYFFGREKEVQEVENLLRHELPVFINLTGERRIGRTSFLQCFPKFSSSRKLGKLFVHVDIQFIYGTKDTEEFYEEVSYQVENRGFDIEIENNKELNAKEKFIVQLKVARMKNIKLVFMLDEIQIITGQDSVFTEEFFKEFIQLAEVYQFHIILASPHPLDKPETLARRLKRVHLGSLTEEEAKELIIKPAAMVGIDFKQEVDFVLDNAGRFPFFIQMCCYYLIKEDLNRHTALKNFQREAEPHMGYIISISSEEEIAAMRQIADCKETDSAIADNLVQKGYVLSENGKYRIFSRILARLLKRI